MIAPFNELYNRVSKLPTELGAHIDRSLLVGQQLATVHQGCLDKVKLGILAHDLARAMSDSDLLHFARNYGLPINEIELSHPMLLHGPVAAFWLENQYGVSDVEVIESVYWHTVGKRGMSEIGKMVFLADKLDAQKITRRPFLSKVMDLALINIDHAIVEYLNNVLSSLVKRGYLIHPESLYFRNELLLDMKSENREV